MNVNACVHLKVCHSSIGQLRIWTLVRKMTSFRFPEKVIVLYG